MCAWTAATISANAPDIFGPQHDAGDRRGPEDRVAGGQDAEVVAHGAQFREADAVALFANQLDARLDGGGRQVGGGGHRAPSSSWVAASSARDLVSDETHGAVAGGEVLKGTTGEAGEKPRAPRRRRGQVAELGDSGVIRVGVIGGSGFASAATARPA